MWHDGIARLAQLVAGHMTSDPTGCMYAPAGMQWKKPSSPRLAREGRMQDLKESAWGEGLKELCAYAYVGIFCPLLFNPHLLVKTQKKGAVLWSRFHL